VFENCMLDANGDGIPDFVQDSTGNGVPNLWDPEAATPEDVDGDGIPNHLDIDADNDGVPNYADAAPLDPNVS
jgi:large repetitive protein